MIQSDESLLVSNLLSSKFEDPIVNGNSIELYIEKRNNLVASIVLMANEQKMSDLLTMLSDALVSMQFLKLKISEILLCMHSFKNNLMVVIVKQI